jgi:hypothetical protein
VGRSLHGRRVSLESGYGNHVASCPQAPLIPLPRR